MVLSLNKKTFGGNVIVKIDMAKAYDGVDWDFLLEVFKAFGFSNNFCHLVGECVKSLWFSVMMNETFKGFSNLRVVYGKETLYLPYIFIVMEEVLTQLLKKNFEEGQIGSFSHPARAPLISHLLYANDLLIFMNGGKRSIKRLIDTLAMYERWSGQLINKKKSAIFPSKLITSSRKCALFRLTGFKEGKIPVIYWSAPLISGRLTVHIIEPLVERVRKKVAWWKFKSLSQGGG